MSSYSLKLKLPSADVDTRLLNDMEEYILKRVRDLGLPLEDSPPATFMQSVSVSDSRGILRHGSVSDIGVLFDDTRDITLSIHSGDQNRRAEVSVRFSTERQYNVAEIRYCGPSPRENATSIAQGIRDIVGTKKNNNWRYHPPSVIGALMWALSIMSIVVTLEAAVAIIVGTVEASHLPVFRKVTVISLMLAASFSAYNWLLPRVRPYAKFDTRLNTARDRYANWLAYATLTFLVFGILLTFLRVKLLGF